MVMPILVKALLDKRARLEELALKIGRETLIERHPEAEGYLRSEDGYRLYDARDELIEKLHRAVSKQAPSIEASNWYPLAEVGDDRSRIET